MARRRCPISSVRRLDLRPDRIPIGEVRGAEALDLLKAWGAGHPGGVGTLHAGSAIGALRRLEQLIQEAAVTVPRASGSRRLSGGADGTRTKESVAGMQAAI